MASKHFTYQHTARASYIGYVTQAIINNLPPLMFVTFQGEFDLSLQRVTLLITLNFVIQLLVDMAAIPLVDRIGYRVTVVSAHVCSFVGLFGLGILPYVCSNPYMGLALAMTVNAIGGGLIEVIISPIVEALPNDKKNASMSLLHSFYCWGSVLVVLISTLFFLLIGIRQWRYLTMFWSLVPLGNAVLFCLVPIKTLIEENDTPLSLGKLFKSKTFIVFTVLMVCAGASELAMSQWASLFAETGLNVSKTVGDLLGPCLFAILMGSARVFYARKMAHFRLEYCIFGSSVLCVGSYLLTIFSPYPILSLMGCGLTGLFVGILWPATFRLSSIRFPKGNTAMFAILALAGDVGCAAGPSLVGWVANHVKNQRMTFFHRLFEGMGLNEIGLKTGLLFAIVFPATLAVLVYFKYATVTPSGFSYCTKFDTQNTRNRKRRGM